MNLLKHDILFTIEVYPLGWLLCAPEGQRGIAIKGLYDSLPLFGKGAVMDAGIAGALGGVSAIGTEKNCKKWREQITSELEAQSIGKPAKWIRGVDCGLSSGTLFCRLVQNYALHDECVNRFGFREYEPKYIPSDSSDFGRCLRMIEYLGWHDRLNEARAISPEWDRIIHAWDNLCVLYKDGKHKEVGDILKSIAANATNH